MTLTIRNRPQLSALTGLRFFAAMSVVLYHYRSSIPFPFVIRRIVQQGNVGVSMFFVLSGFILYYTYHEWFISGVHHRQYWFFARARFARVYPMNVIALLLITPLTLGLSGMWMPTLHLAVTWISDMLSIQTYIPNSADQSAFNAPAWSISDEFVFYALFPFFVAFVLGRCRRCRDCVLLLLGLFSVQAIAFFGTLIIVPQIVGSADGGGRVVQDLVYAHPAWRVWEFFIGCTLGALFYHMSQRSDDLGSPPLQGLIRAMNHKAAFPVITGCILAVAAAPARIWPWREMGYGHVASALPYTPLFALVILVLARSPRSVPSLLSHPVTVLLGEASYSLYMLHWLPFILFDRWQRSWIFESTIPHFHLIAVGTMAVLFIIVTILISIAVHKWVETPLRRLLRGSESTTTGAHPVYRRA